MSLPYYRHFGWEATVLCVTPNSSDGVYDAPLEESLPRDIEVVRVEAWSVRKCRRFGFGHLDYRCLVPLYYAGRRLLKRRDYDVVFFSSTAFLTFLLGPIWKYLFGCRIVYDFQDPWFLGEASPYTRENVPGRWWKYRLGQIAARLLESFALSHADHVISVSPGYVKILLKRYPQISKEKFTVIPFGAEEQDFIFARDKKIRHNIFAPCEGLTRWVSVGRAGPDMDPVLGVFFEQLVALRKDDPAFVSGLRVHFVGTNYSPAERTSKAIMPLATQYEVQDLVEEHSVRIPYFQALSLYAESDAVLLIGSTSADYTASKVFNCILSKKPVLALFHQDSLVSKIIARFSNVHLGQFEFDPAEPGFAAAVSCGIKWLRNAKCEKFEIDRELKPWSAKQLTREQCLIFDRVCGR
jgi:hypothetical protein